MVPICTVLLVENNPDDVRLVELAFEKGRVRHCLRAVNNGLQAMDYLAGRGRYADREVSQCPNSSCWIWECPVRAGLNCWNGCRENPN
jgi:hypothetical protein